MNKNFYAYLAFCVFVLVVGALLFIFGNKAYAPWGIVIGMIGAIFFTGLGDEGFYK